MFNMRIKSAIDSNQNFDTSLDSTFYYIKNYIFHYNTFNSYPMSRFPHWYGDVINGWCQEEITDSELVAVTQFLFDNNLYR